MPIGPSLLCLVTLLFNRHAIGLLPRFGRLPMSFKMIKITVLPLSGGILRLI